MTYNMLSNLNYRLATSFSFAILGIYAYNNYDKLPSFSDIKNKIISNFESKKTIKQNAETNTDENNVVDNSGNIFSDHV